MASFFGETIGVLKTVIILIGAGLGAWGIVNLLEGYGNDNAGAKSQGMKQLMAGVGIAVLGFVLVPKLQTMVAGELGGGNTAN